MLRVRRAGAVCADRLHAPGPSAGDSPGSAARGRLLAVCCAVTPGSAGQAARRRRPGSIEGGIAPWAPCPSPCLQLDAPQARAGASGGCVWR